MPAFHGSAIRNLNIGPLPKHCPSLLDLVCPSERHLRYLEAELGRSTCCAKESVSPSVLVQPIPSRWHCFQSVSGTACLHLMSHEQAGQKGEINLCFVTLLSPTASCHQRCSNGYHPSLEMKEQPKLFPTHCIFTLCGLKSTNTFCTRMIK